MQLYSAYPKKRDQQGLTLAELLVTLVILSLVIVGSGLAFQAVSPRLALDHAKVQLMTDLKRVRMKASSDNASAFLMPQKSGYSIETLGLIRKWPRRINAIWPDHNPETGILLTGLKQNQDWSVTLTSGENQARITIERLTGRIHG